MPLGFTLHTSKTVVTSMNTCIMFITCFPPVPSFTHIGTEYTSLLLLSYSTLTHKVHSRNTEHPLLLVSSKTHGDKRLGFPFGLDCDGSQQDLCLKENVKYLCTPPFLDTSRQIGAGWQGTVLLPTAVMGSKVETAPFPHSSCFLPGSKGSAITQLHTRGTVVSTPSSAAAGDYSFERLFKKP